MNLHRHCGLLLSPFSFLKIFLHLLSDFTTDLEAIRPWIYTVGVKNCYVTIGTENYFMNLYVYLSVNKVLDRYQNADALLKGNETKNVFNKCSSLNDCRPRLLKIKTVLIKKKFSFCLSYASDMKFVNEEQTQPYVFLFFSSLFTTRNVYIYFGVDMFIGQPSLSLIKFLK